MRRITLVIGHLGLGGSERVMCDLASRWSAAGVSVTLLTLTQQSNPDFYQPASGVNRTDLDFPGTRRRTPPPLKALSCLWNLRRAIARSRPDVVVSFLTTTNVTVLLATTGLSVPVVVAERSDPLWEPIRPRWARLRAWTYRRAAAIVVQTTAAAAFFVRQGRTRTFVIPNAVRPVVADASSRTNHSGRMLLAVGRLSVEKRFDRLIAAFAALARKHVDWNLTIVGEGPERPALERQIDGADLAQRVTLAGRTESPDDYYRAASVFALTSVYEGFPNALCEAMACGVAVVSTDCPSGPANVIRNGLDGYLVAPGDQQALIEKLDLVMSDAVERDRLGQNARSIAGRFSPERVMGLWNTLIDEVVHG